MVADTRQQKQLGSSNIATLWAFFNKTIIPLAHVGYEIVIANGARSAELAITISYPTRARGIIVKYNLPVCRFITRKIAKQFPSCRCQANLISSFASNNFLLIR